MSDETTPGPAFPLRDRIGAALTTACSEHSHCDRMGPAVWAVVQPELDRRDAEIKRLTKLNLDGGRLLSSLKRDLGEMTMARDALARVKALAEDMRTWCSPYGIADHYAQRIDEAIEPPEPDGIEADSEAEFAAKLGTILRKHRADVHPEHDEACANCAVTKGAPEVLTAGLDDLPAVREFVAGFDPRGEST